MQKQNSKIVTAHADPLHFFYVTIKRKIGSCLKKLEYEVIDVMTLTLCFSPDSTFSRDGIMVKAGQFTWEF